MKKNNMKNIVLVLYIILLMLCVKFSINTYIQFFFFFVYMLLSFKKVKTILNKKNILSIFLFVSIFLLVGILNFNIITTIKNLFNIIIWASPIIVYFFEIENFKKYKGLKNIVIILLIYLIVINFYYLNKDIYFARIMANYEFNIPGYSGLALFSGGGYYFIYGLIILSLYELFLLKNEHKKLFSFMVFCISCLLIIKSNFATAFLLLIIGILIYIIFSICIKKRKFLFAVILIPLILISVILFSDNLLKLTISLLPENSIISTRLSGIGEYDSTSTFSERIQLQLQSFNSIKEHPIFGVAGKYNYNYILMREKLGLHTEWVDFIAQYGLILSIIYFAMIFKAFKALAKRYKNTPNYPIILTTIIVTILLGFLDPIRNTSVLLMLFIVIPLFCENRQCVINNSSQF